MDFIFEGKYYILSYKLSSISSTFMLYNFLKNNENFALFFLCFLTLNDPERHVPACFRAKF